MKNTIIGIDVGGSTTKIVGFRQNGETRTLISPLLVKASDPLTSLYGAFGKFLAENGLSLDEIEKIKITGVGSSYITQPIYGLPCEKVSEFESIGKGGLYISGLEEAIVVSMGTGTALSYAKRGGKCKYLGGTGVGGGTLVGLSKLLLGMDNVDHVEALAEAGNLDNIDLKVRSISDTRLFPDLPSELTASNFGNISDLASKEDIALGIINTVFETVAMLSLFAARGYGLSDIVLTGNMTVLHSCAPTFDTLSKLFHVNFIIPENARFATVIGAALE